MRKDCPVCGSHRLHAVTQRPSVPVHQHILYESREAARGARRGYLNIVACLTCGFVFNSAFDIGLMSYGAEYESDQTYSHAFASHVDGLISLLLNDKGIRDARILEVGSGKGSFLRSLVEAPGAGNTGWGFDPSYIGPEVDLDGRLRFVRSFYTDDHASLPADVAICRHVIEHVPDPVALLTRLRNSSTNPRVFMETKDVKWALRNAVIWDFFYEYCSYFSQRSLSAVFARAGFGKVESKHIFGEQYIWVEASCGSSSQKTASELVSSDVLEALVASYTLNESDTLARWTETLELLRKQGPIALWGAGAKGVTFASLFDPKAEMISCVVDLNPAKQGRYIAGSGHSIVSSTDLTRIGVKNVVLLNPNYSREVQELLVKESPAVRVIVKPVEIRVA